MYSNLKDFCIKFSYGMIYLLNEIDDLCGSQKKIFLLYDFNEVYKDAINIHIFNDFCNLQRK